MDPGKPLLALLAKPFQSDANFFEHRVVLERRQFRHHCIHVRIGKHVTVKYVGRDCDESGFGQSLADAFDMAGNAERFHQNNDGWKWAAATRARNITSESITELDSFLIHRFLL